MKIRFSNRYLHQLKLAVLGTTLDVSLLLNLRRIENLNPAVVEQQLVAVAF